MTEQSGLWTSPTTDTRKSTKFARLAERVSIFDYTSEYLPGHKNVVADCLSHLLMPSTEPAIDDHVLGTQSFRNGFLIKDPLWQM